MNFDIDSLKIKVTTPISRGNSKKKRKYWVCLDVTFPYKNMLREKYIRKENRGMMSEYGHWKDNNLKKEVLFYLPQKKNEICTYWKNISDFNSHTFFLL